MNAESHGHHHPHHHHAAGTPLAWAVLATVSFAAVEAAGGWWSGSLALLGDAGHMITDATALGMAWLATWIARRPPSPRHTYGLGRAEILSAMVNGLLMFGIVGAIVYTAVQRLHAAPAVAGGTVMIIAAGGLLVNSAIAYVLSRGARTISTRGALLHVMGDMLGSIAALATGAVIYSTGWTPIDPILSIFISVLILISSVKLLGDALHVVMEGVPHEIDAQEVGRALAAVDGVHSVHDLHIWALSSGTVVLSAHVVIEDLARWERLLDALHGVLRERFDITHATLQPEPLTRIVRPLRDARHG